MQTRPKNNKGDARPELAGIGEHGDTPEERAEAEALAELLWDFLRKDPEHQDRRRTGSGTKTKLGLLRTVKSVLSPATEGLERSVSELRAMLRETSNLGEALAVRTSTIDGELLGLLEDTREHDIGEVTRLRVQIKQNRALIARTEPKQ